MSSTKSETSTKSEKTEKKDKDDEGVSAYKDVSGAAEQAAEDAQAPTEFDELGDPVPKSSEAAQELADEQAKRAAGQVNGGGPWPEDLLRKNYIGSEQRMQPALAPYTSHEES
jgi:hypothetical protein